MCVKGLACTYFSRGGKDWGRGNRPVINVSWDDDARDLRSANRDWNVRNFNIFGYYGFRLAQDE